MPEKFRANDSESNGFWFFKKTHVQNKQKKNAPNPAKDIISQADDVVKKCMLISNERADAGYKKRKLRLNGTSIMLITIALVGVLVYFLNMLQA